MQNTVYYSKKYISKQNQQAVAQSVPMPRAASRKAGKMGVAMIVGCLAVAVLMVMFIPVLVDGAPPSASTTAPAAKAQNIAAFASAQEAAGFVSLEACLPTAIPEGYGVLASRVVDDTVLEVEYTDNKNVIIFRAAPGSDDLSGQDFDTYAYTATETVDGVARGYAGVSEKKLDMAVWADGAYSYAIVTQNSLEASQLKLMAESIQ